MGTLGLIVVSTFYWCFFVSFVTARLHWIYICFWLIPIHFMAVNFQHGMEINGLMVIFCITMFFMCRKSLMGVALWNIQKRKEHPLFLNILHFVVVLVAVYSFSQAQIQGYMFNFQGWGSKINFFTIIITLIPMIFLTRTFSHMLYMSIDMISTRKENIVLLACNFFISNELGIENSIFKGYFVQGIQNGVSYQFRMTKRSYKFLRENNFIKLELNRGFLGGLYVYDFENSQHSIYEKYLPFGIFCYSILIIISIYYFWFL